MGAEAVCSDLHLVALCCLGALGGVHDLVIDNHGD